jgi:hypothetical protein
MSQFGRARVKGVPILAESRLARHPARFPEPTCDGSTRQGKGASLHPPGPTAFLQAPPSMITMAALRQAAQNTAGMLGSRGSAAWKTGIERGNLDAPAVAAKAVCDAPVVDVAAGDGFGIDRHSRLTVLFRTRTLPKRYEIHAVSRASKSIAVRRDRVHRSECFRAASRK